MQPAVTHEMQSLNSRIVAGVSWSCVGTVISSGLTFLASLTVARILGESGFGELAMIQSTAHMVSVCAVFGLGLFTTKFIAEYRVQQPERAASIVVLALITATVTGSLASAMLYVFAPHLARSTLAAEHLGTALQISSVLLLVTALESVLHGVLSGLESFRAISTVIALKGICAFPLLAAGATFAGLNGVLVGMVAAGCVGLALSAWCVMRELKTHNIRLHNRKTFADWNLIISFGLPAFLSMAIFAASEWSARTILVNHSDGYSELGAFNAADRFLAALLLISSLLNRPLVPVVSHELSIAGHGQAAAALGFTMKMNAIVVLPFVIVGAVLSPFLMGLFGAKFTNDWPALVIVLAAAGIAAVLGPIGHWIVASRRLWLNVAQYSVWGVSLITLTYVFMSWGATGLALARLGAYGIHGILILFTARKLIFTGHGLPSPKTSHVWKSLFGGVRRSV
jgi:O-antigen/teichoic acid export membrane protein